MQKSMRIVMALALVGLRCRLRARRAEEVVYVDEPVSVEPTYTGKYK